MRGWLVVLALVIPVQAVSAQLNVLAWGNNGSGACNVPVVAPGIRAVDVSAGSGFTMALLDDGTILGWGANGVGQCNPLPLPAGIVYTDVATGYFHVLALRSDGALVAWGDNANGQCNVPILSPGVSFVKVDGGRGFSVAILSDGSIAYWGLTGLIVPPLPPGVFYVDLSVLNMHVIALRSDGQAVGWGANDYGQTNVPTLPQGLRYLKVGAGWHHSVALRSDGVWVAWGATSPGLPIPPVGLAYTSMEAGFFSTELLRCDGLPVHWGGQSNNLHLVPTLPAGTQCVQISRGEFHAVLIHETGACGTVSSYCTPGTSVSGCVPVIQGTGVPSVAGTSPFEIGVSNINGQRQGMVVYGTTPAEFQWASASSSYLCVALPVQRTGVQLTAGTAGQCDGQLAINFNAWITVNPNGLGSPFATGQVLYAQGWYRDPGAPKHTNLSNGLRFVLCP
jgi:hypothetical protein